MMTREASGDAPQRETMNGPPAGVAHDSRDLFVFRAGGQSFAVYAEEVEAAGENLRPAPLPFAPPAVVGVVPVRGRMRTALDPLRLLDAPAQPDPETGEAQAAAQPAQAVTKPPARLFIALAGDEQLALACDSAEGSVTIHDSRLEFAPDRHAPVRARVEHEGRTITLLDPSRLFDAAMRGTDRRRRRS